jgi:hypothetical protein
MYSTITESVTSATLMVKSNRESFHPWNLMMERETSSNSCYFENIKMADNIQKNSHVHCYLTVTIFSTYAEPWDLYLLHSSVKVKVKRRNCVAVRLTYRSVRLSQGHTHMFAGTKEFEITEQREELPYGESRHLNNSEKHQTRQKNTSVNMLLHKFTTPRGKGNNA